MVDSNDSSPSDETWDELSNLWQQSPVQKQSAEKLQSLVMKDSQKIRFWSLVELVLTLAFVVFGLYLLFWGSSDKDRVVAFLLLFYSPVALAWNFFYRAPIYKATSNNTLDYLDLTQQRIKRGYMLVRVSWLQFWITFATLLALYIVSAQQWLQLDIHGPLFFVKAVVMAGLFAVWSVWYKRQLKRREQTVAEIKKSLIE